jgi:hypothetical protein
MTISGRQLCHRQQHCQAPNTSKYNKIVLHRVKRTDPNSYQGREHIGLIQKTISMQIKKLEGIVGLKRQLLCLITQACRYYEGNQGHNLPKKTTSKENSMEIEQDTEPSPLS